MVTVIHGDNQLASRQRLVAIRLELERRGLSIITFDGRHTTIEAIGLASTTSTLLGATTAVLVEDFFSARRQKGRAKNDTALEAIEGAMVFWESGQLSKTILESLPKTVKIEHFPLPQIIFKLVDDLSPHPSTHTLEALHNALQQQPWPLVLSMLGWQVRQLLWAREDPDSLQVPVWKKRQIISQAQKFTTEQLYWLHHKLCDVDRAQKTGKLTIDISQQLDFILAGL